MNTLVSITVISELGTIETHNIIDQAFSKFIEVARKYTRFDQKSELSILNNASRSAPHHVSTELMHLAKYSLDIAHKSDGLFDPTIIDLLEIYGYGAKQDFSKLDNPELMQEIQRQIKNRPSFEEIILDETNSTIQLAKDQRLDLGSIGKGYAIDLAYDMLAQHFSSFIINAGGDIRAHGKKEVGKPWVVGLEKTSLPNQTSKTEDKYWGMLPLNGKALAASGSSERNVKFFHHLLNPRTGLPVHYTNQTFVVANRAIDADAWATTLFIAGHTLAETLAPKDIDWLIVDDRGRTHFSRNFRYLIHAN